METMPTFSALMVVFEGLMLVVVEHVNGEPAAVDVITKIVELEESLGAALNVPYGDKSKEEIIKLNMGVWRSYRAAMTASLN